MEDEDQDTVADEIDNCDNIPNPDQVETDEDSVGDACDNCPDDPTRARRTTIVTGAGTYATATPTGTGARTPRTTASCRSTRATARIPP